jgi:hypothetical protein
MSQQRMHRWSKLRVGSCSSRNRGYGTQIRMSKVYLEIIYTLCTKIPLLNRNDGLKCRSVCGFACLCLDVVQAFVQGSFCPCKQLSSAQERMVNALARSKNLPHLPSTHVGLGAKACHLSDSPTLFKVRSSTLRPRRPKAACRKHR